MCCTTVARILDLCPYILGSDYRFSEDSAKCSTYPGPWGKLSTRSSAWRWIWSHWKSMWIRFQINECCMIGTPIPVVVPCKRMWPKITEEPCFFGRFTKPLHNPGQVNNVFDITELHCWISGNFCMQHQEIFIGNPMTSKLSLSLERFSSYSHKTTTHSILDDKLIGVSWTPPMWIQ